MDKNAVARTCGRAVRTMSGIPSPAGERRRHHRYEAASIGCRVEWIRAAPEAVQARNLSAGGICLLTGRPLEPGQQITLRISLPEPMGSAVASCVVRWSQPSPDSSGWLAGAEVTESTKAWLGPQENCRNEIVL